MNKWRTQAFMRLLSAVACAGGALLLPNVAKVFWWLVAINLLLAAGNIGMLAWERRKHG